MSTRKHSRTSSFSPHQKPSTTNRSKRQRTSLLALILCLLLLIAFAHQPVTADLGKSGPPTPAEVKETVEKKLRKDSEGFYHGVKSKVTFEWSGPIVVGNPVVKGRIPTDCYPVKLSLKVTAEDPRDGRKSTDVRGIDGKIGGQPRAEIFCFTRDGFGEWEFILADG